jgi:hypothetical protein
MKREKRNEKRKKIGQEKKDNERNCKTTITLISIRLFDSIRFGGSVHQLILEHVSQ